MAELFRTKKDHIPVEANKLTSENVVALAAWCDGVSVVEHDALQHDITYAAINVPTPFGMRRAQEGDWIAHVNQDFLVIKSTDFDSVLEAVVDG